MLNIINYVAIGLTILGSIFGIVQFIKSKKLKRITLSMLQTAAGDLCKIQQSTEWTFNNIRTIQNLAVNLSDSELKKQIIRTTSDGQGDGASADRLVITLFSHIMILQESQFNKKEIIHPEKNELPLWKKYSDRNSHNIEKVV